MSTLNKTDVEVDPRAFLSLLIERGIVGDKTINDVNFREVEQQGTRIAYHNTKLLLKHYRTILWLLEYFPDAVATELEHSDGEYSVSIKKTRQLVDRVNEALSVLKKKPGDGGRLYELIYLSYVASETMTHNELLFRLNISSRQYYRMREQAINVLSLHIWSILSKEAGLWFEILTFLDELS